MGSSLNTCPIPVVAQPFCSLHTLYRFRRQALLLVNGEPSHKCVPDARGAEWPVLQRNLGTKNLKPRGTPRPTVASSVSPGFKLGSSGTVRS